VRTIQRGHFSFRPFVKKVAFFHGRRSLSGWSTAYYSGAPSRTELLHTPDQPNAIRGSRMLIRLHFRSKSRWQKNAK
jgi:hypothetical protein